MSAPRLVPVRLPSDPKGVVLVLHGGASRRGSPMVSPTQLSVLRMVPIARGVARAGRGRLAVFRLLNSARGWDTGHTPVQDARWALDQVRERYGSRPVCLVGHSLGGRAALLAGGEPGVHSVVALNPWVYASDDADLSGRQVLVVHGAADRIAPPSRSAQVARRLGRRTRVGYISVPGGKHAMLAHHAQFDRYAAQFATATLLGDEAPGPVGQVLAGEDWVTA
ncbi:MAG: alpha/beta hydrolase [Marmoricola sp.]